MRTNPRTHASRPRRDSLSGASPRPRPPSPRATTTCRCGTGGSPVDPYHWLREKGSPEVVKYLEAENAYTEATTADLKPFREALYTEMLGRIKQTDLGVPTRDGRFFYYRRTVEGLQYPIRCRKRGAGTVASAKRPPRRCFSIRTRWRRACRSSRSALSR